MALTQVPIELSSTPGIVDNSNATAITIDSSENVLVGTTTHRNFSGDTTEITVGTTATGATKGGAVTFGSGSGFLGYLAFQESEGTLGTLTSVPLVFKTGNTERMRIDSSGNVGIGTSSPADALHVLDSSGNAYVSIGRGTQSQGEVGLRLRGGTSGNDWYVYQKTSSNNLNFYNTADRVTIDSSGNVGIGTTSVTGNLQILTATAGSVLNVNHNTGGSYPKASGIGLGATSTALTVSSDGSTVSFTGGAGLYAENTAASGNPTNLVFWTNLAGTPAEAMRILANGTLLVGKSADDNSVGFKTNTNSTYMVASGQTPTYINRLSSAGDLLEFRNDSSGTVGRIGTNGGFIYIEPQSSGNGLTFLNTSVSPCTSSGAVSDNFLNLGTSSRRFKDLHLSGIMHSGTGLINTTISRSGAALNVRAGNNQIQVVFQNSATNTIGYIGNVSDSSTLYSTSSDERLKENITDADDSGSKIDAIQVRQFDWKADGIHEDYGMVAQELQTVAPEAVFEPEDPDEMMGVDYSKLVPMLVKEIQSLRERVQQLENN